MGERLISKKSDQIHVWVPELFSTGGIQAFSRFLISAVKDNPQAAIVFSKQDSMETLNKNISGQIQCAYGDWPAFLQTFIFSGAVFFNAALKRPALIVITLAHFAPIAMLLKKIFKIPYVVVAHGVEVWDMKRFFLKRSLEESDLILAVSKYTKDRIVAQNFKSPQRIVIFQNTYDEKRFYFDPSLQVSIRKKHGVRPDDFVLISVGRLCRSEKYKGHEMVMRAMKGLSNLALKYLIVGDGDYREDLKKIASGMGLQDRIIFAGRVSEDELPDYYRASNLFVMPSMGEGFGIVYLEAMACGLPVIAGNQDGSVDALCRGELGALVNPENESEVKNAIEEILKKKFPLPLLYDPLALSQKVSARFGFKIFKERLSACLKPWL